ncbi:putative defensin-like protein 184 [Arabidopsis thaliana]|uniref:Putative defensin-like protein 184 n=3 Tax=Arabidopsis TaxID=3701 RepID=DF184_ARATH|nr:low-molecular-weight cysteine-rich 18 [Arabidopsis thaliana]P82732.1 RecName: Full=Putative defensin-like protein 184; AltName: Full=Putative low-molecular-weight cysteine-rich protein 18; Short=Protein LCR18; Flags: Precursor [Arabidopsis thaliana]KAG7624069.1 hypothetical protein ISN45_At03g004570 [Arabidopsis thaliana x Arabidopsis arenosa]AEE74163.1 low-molecular-weight cysteine-rich 18 [Arabidopsis thaliana]OAP01221.1 LCR18 [Arabidopsis thaliana]CAA0381373.1 unnamed protein product [Ar|eukprot:NP_001030639.1 low-molecular-weight cysteine-rich 18 [Arabidopsis thaliana]
MKNSSILFVLIIVVFLISSSGNKKMVGEAKKCDQTWTCEGEDKCREKCLTLHNGVGVCDLYTAPLVPKQCFCHYDC